MYRTFYAAIILCAEKLCRKNTASRRNTYYKVKKKTGYRARSTNRGKRQRIAGEFADDYVVCNAVELL